MSLDCDGFKHFTCNHFCLKPAGFGRAGVVGAFSKKKVDFIHRLSSNMEEKKKVLEANVKKK